MNKVTPAEQLQIEDQDTKEFLCFSKYVTDIIEEDKEQTFCYVVINATMYFLVKLIPLIGYLKCLKPCKLHRDKKLTMKRMVETLHLGPPVDYEGATNLINTILLICALFLSFVAATATTIEAETYLEMDLNSCQMGWGHQETCIQIDTGGYFGSYNATGILKNGTKYPNKPGDPVDLSGLEFLIWPDSVTQGREIPSVAVNRWSALSAAALMIVFIYSVFWYLLLVVSGARSMGEVMMGKFWSIGVMLVILFLIILLVSVIAWVASIQRIMSGLLPMYPVTGIEFGYFTNKDDITDNGQYFMGWAVDAVAINSCFVILPLTLVHVFSVITAEWTIVKNRPITPKEFIYFTMARLNRTHELNIDNKNDGNYVCRCEQREVENALGYKIQVGKKQCKEVAQILASFEKYGIKMDPEEYDKDQKKKDNVVESMDHFLDMWPHIAWEDDSLEPGTVGEKGIKQLYRTALTSMYAELYPGHF